MTNPREGSGTVYLTVYRAALVGGIIKAGIE
jgi:hypothetical protein